MRKNVLLINRATGRLFISTMFGSPVDKEKLPVRLLTSITVLFLILAGSPLAYINTQAANAQSNPYASDTTPPASVSNPITTTGNFYINNTWVNPPNSDFKYTWFRYNNGTTLQNVSKPANYLNLTRSPHYTQNISAQTVDTSGNINQTKVWFNTTIPNNPPVQYSIGNKFINEGQWLNFTVNATDADNDPITYGTNATKGTFNSTTGNFSWLTTYSDAGTYVWYFNSSDGYGAVASETITVGVVNTPLTIAYFIPTSDPTTTQSTAQTFSISLNRTANVTWLMNGTSIQVNNSVVSADYTNSTAGVGVWNVTANVTDGIDIVSNQWNWTIIPQPTYNVSGYVFDNYGLGLGGVLVQNGSNQNTTSASGYYLITGLLSGTYNFSYSEAGFNTGYLEVTISDADHITANKTIYDTTPPAQVTGLINDTPTQTTVNLTWNSIADANYYQVFRNSTSLGYTQNAYWNDTGLTANTLYQYWIRANDSYNNWDQNSTTLNIETASMPDTTPPIIIVASPQNMLYNTASIPLNVSANKVISTWLYSLNGATNVSFTPNTTITASQGANNLIVYASDIAGNWNSTAVAFSVDTIAPSSVTNLMNVSYATYYINWTWTDPADSDFSKVMVYLNGVFRTNVTKGIQYYVASGLTPAITYTISTRTVDLAGNINSTWVNYSSSTALGVYNVNKGTNYSTIQAAINAASLGDTIEVLSGTYYENVYVSNKLILRGVDTGGGKPVVNAGGTGNAIILTGGITLEGFEATNATHAGWPNIGIEVYSDGNIIKNNTASNNGEGINFESGDNNNTLNGNIANSNEYNGIRFNGNNKNNTIIGNNASNNGNNGITFYNTDMSSINNIVTGNIVNNNTLDGIHLEFSINNTIIGNNASNSSDGITFVSSNNNTIIGNNASNNNNGISFTYGNNNTVTSNTANSNKYYGIGLVSSNNTLSSNLANSNGYAGFYINGKNNTIINNTANNNTGSGLISDSSSYNLLLNNTANSNNYDGIYLYYSSNNTITGNFDNLNKYYGIEIYYSSSNTITSNAVNSNTIYGIRLSTSNNNTIYNNRFNNTNNFNFLGTNINIWNTTRTLGSNILGGFNLGGNFWAKPDGTGFSQTCTDANGDGICDSPYALNTNNTDYLPLSLNFTHP